MLRPASRPPPRQKARPPARCSRHAVWSGCHHSGCDAASWQPHLALMAGARSQNGGWVIELKGFHVHNNLSDKDKKVDVGDEGEEFVKNTLIKKLESGTVSLPDGPNGELMEVPISELGIQSPVVVTDQKVVSVTYMAELSDASNGPVPMTGGPEGTSLAGASIGDQQPKTFELRQYDFIVQFCWQPKPRSSRLKAMAEKKAAHRPPRPPRAHHLQQPQPAQLPSVTKQPMLGPVLRLRIMDQLRTALAWLKRYHFGVNVPARFNRRRMLVDGPPSGWLPSTIPIKK